MLETAELEALDRDRRIERMVMRAAARLGLSVGMLTAAELKKLERLAQTATDWWEPRAAEWSRSGARVHREWPFLIQTESAGQRMLVRGVIDLWWIDQQKFARLKDKIGG